MLQAGALTDYLSLSLPDSRIDIRFIASLGVATIREPQSNILSTFLCT